METKSPAAAVSCPEYETKIATAVAKKAAPRPHCSNAAPVVAQPYQKNDSDNDNKNSKNNPPSPPIIIKQLVYDGDDNDMLITAAAYAIMAAVRHPSSYNNMDTTADFQLLGLLREDDNGDHEIVNHHP